MLETPKRVSLTNSEDPDEMQHNAAFHQGLHCLLRLKRVRFVPLNMLSHPVILPRWRFFSGSFMLHVLRVYL